MLDIQRMGVYNTPPMNKLITCPVCGVEVEARPDGVHVKWHSCVDELRAQVERYKAVEAEHEYVGMNHCLDCAMTLCVAKTEQCNELRTQLEEKEREIARLSLRGPELKAFIVEHVEKSRRCKELEAACKQAIRAFKAVGHTLEYVHQKDAEIVTDAWTAVEQALTPPERKEQG